MRWPIPPPPSARSPRTRSMTPSRRPISARCWTSTATSTARPRSTRSSPRPTTISGIRSTRNTSTSTTPSISTTTDFLPDDMVAGAADRLRLEPLRRQAGRSHSLQEPDRRAGMMSLDPARRAGRAEPVGLALPRAARSGRAGIRRQPDARRSPPRHRLRQIHHRPLGHAAAVRPGAGGRCCTRSCTRRRSTRRSSACRCWSKAWPWAPSRRSSTNGNDPLAKKLTQLVMTDEAFHHKFGKIWADRTIPKLSKEEHEIVENWAAHCFQTLLFNLVAPHQMTAIYAEFGLDPDKVMAELPGSRHRRSAPRAHEGSAPTSSACW